MLWGYAFIAWGTKTCAGVQENAEGYILQTVAENCIHNYHQTQKTRYPFGCLVFCFLVEGTRTLSAYPPPMESWTHDPIGIFSLLIEICIRL